VPCELDTIVLMKTNSGILFIIIFLLLLLLLLGFRYELYCVAKAHKTTHCVLHCDTPKETCQQWNMVKENRYHDEILDALIMRFETPDSRNRWDSPLFVIQVHNSFTSVSLKTSA